MSSDGGGNLNEMSSDGSGALNRNLNASRLDGSETTKYVSAQNDWRRI
jgi:hypothetical protein